MTFLAATFLAGLLAAHPDGPDASARLETTRKVLADESRPLDERAALALEEAAALDREAQASRTATARGERSGEAIRLLDDFNSAQARNPFETSIALQAAVYAWADGRRSLESWRLDPRDGTARTRAVERLDEAIRRLERIEPDLSGADPLVAQNGRFRTAQALADRAILDGDTSRAGRERLGKALAALDPMPKESAVEPHARLLRAEILTRQGDLDRAGAEADAAARLNPPPPAAALIEVRTRIFLGQRRYGDAIRAIDAAGLDPVARDAMAVDVLLAQRSDAISGSSRAEAETDALRRAATLRGSNRPEARAALHNLGRALDVPPAHAEPEAWDVLAEAALSLGDAPRASRLVASAADRARTLGNPGEAARLLLRAGAILFQAGDYAGADAFFDRAWNAPGAGPIRPKAGMLRALARGRAVEERQPGASRAAYLAALRDQVRGYPDDPTAPEARWLLGSAEHDDGRDAEAVALWRAIPAGHPRWLAARLAVADVARREIDELRLGDDTDALRAKYREATAFLRESARLATAPGDVMELDLASVRLDLTPGVGRFELARALCDRLGHQAGSPEQHARARVLRIVALAMTGRIAEAETEIRSAIDGAPPAELLDAARMIDRAAEAVESDANRLRLGRLDRAITEGLSRNGKVPDTLAPGLKLRSIRAAILAGDSELARRLLRAEPPLDPNDFAPDDLRDLADAFLRLDAPGMAVVVERLRGRRLTPGTPAWLESRYLLALALYRDRKPADARSILDATAILHPELGSKGLKARFERLRQRLDQE